MSGAQKQRLNEILQTIWFEEKMRLTYIYEIPVVDKIYMDLFSLNFFTSEFYSLECVGSNPTSKIIEPQKKSLDHVMPSIVS